MMQENFEIYCWKGRNCPSKKVFYPIQRLSICSALAAAEHGDARRALDLLRVAGEVAERRVQKRLLKNMCVKPRSTLNITELLKPSTT